MLSLIFLVIIIVEYGCSKRSMIWICGTPCGEKKEELMEFTQLLDEVSPRSVTDISYELYELKEDSQIGKRTDIDMTDYLVNITGAHGERVNLFPMIVSFDINNLRELFSDMEEFINQAVYLLRKNPNYAGFNIDFEPYRVSGVTEEDAENYFNFLAKLSSRLKGLGKEVNIDIASYDVFWKKDRIANDTEVSFEITMDTYCQNMTEFKSYLDSNVKEVGEEKIGIGLESYTGLTETQLKERFQLINNKKVNFVSIWKLQFVTMKKESFWWNVLEEYLNC